MAALRNRYTAPFLGKLGPSLDILLHRLWSSSQVVGRGLDNSIYQGLPHKEYLLLQISATSYMDVPEYTSAGRALSRKYKYTGEGFITQNVTTHETFPGVPISPSNRSL